MEHLGTLLAVLAMMVGFSALWLAADARRRAEGDTAQFIRLQAAALRKEILGTQALVGALDTRLKTAERRLAAAEGEGRELDALRGDIAVLRSTLGALQQVRSTGRERNPLPN